MKSGALPYSTHPRGIPPDANHRARVRTGAFAAPTVYLGVWSKTIRICETTDFAKLSAIGSSGAT